LVLCYDGLIHLVGPSAFLASVHAMDLMTFHFCRPVGFMMVSSIWWDRQLFSFHPCYGLSRLL